MSEEFINRRKRTRPKKIGKALHDERPVYFELSDKDVSNSDNNEEKKPLVSPLDDSFKVMSDASKSTSFREPLINLSMEHNPYKEAIKKEAKFFEKILGKEKLAESRAINSLKKKLNDGNGLGRKVLFYVGILSSFMVASWALANAPSLYANIKYQVADSNIVAPNADTVEAKKPETTKQELVEGPDKIIIPALGVDAPLILSDQTTEAGIMKDLEKGVVHYGNTPLPGQAGNSVIFGHSSNYLWAPGNYKNVFALLPRLKSGDTIEVHYSGRKYVYKVNDVYEVKPSEIDVLKSADKTPKISLIACVPVGTNWKRIIVEATQISPTPSNAVVGPHLPQI